MNNEIMQNLGAVLGALNSISVSGKNNLANLSGSIAMIEKVMGTLSECDITPHTEQPKKK